MGRGPKNYSAYLHVWYDMLRRELSTSGTGAVRFDVEITQGGSQREVSRLLRATRSITEIFEKIYPVLASTHETEIYEEMA